MNAINAHSPRWGNADHTVIELVVEFEGIGEVPFGASADDVEEHGRALYARALEGEFGPIASYVEPVRTPEQQREDAKRARAAAVDSITVTTAAGHTFDGDETSQGRMARAIIALQATGTPTVRWVLSNNSVIDATPAELTEALALAGAAQAAIWVLA